MKTILVIGATSGIGEKVVHELAEKNHHLLIAGRDMDKLHRIAKDVDIRFQVKATPISFEALAFDTHEEFWKTCASIAPDIQGVVFCVGYLGDQTVAQDDFAEASNIIDTNYKSAVSILNIIANEFEQRKHGFICAISSVAGDRGRQSNYMYGSSKGALTIYLQGLRNRLASSNVNVLTVKPGFVNTKMTAGLLDDSPLVSEPEQIAKIIVKGIKRKRNVIYTPLFWCAIMLIIKLIPEPIFKKMKL